MAGAQATPAHLGQLIAGLPPGSLWPGAGLGHHQLRMNALGLLYGHGARVGLEDTLWLDAARRTPATNEALVQRVARLARLLGRAIATPAEVRAALGLPAH